MTLKRITLIKSMIWILEDKMLILSNWLLSKRFLNTIKQHITRIYHHTILLSLIQLLTKRTLLIHMELSLLNWITNNSNYIHNNIKHLSKVGQFHKLEFHKAMLEVISMATIWNLKEWLKYLLTYRSLLLAL
jgi:hypothetical protein